MTTKRERETVSPENEAHVETEAAARQAAEQDAADYVAGEDTDGDRRGAGRVRAIAVTAQRNALATYYGTQAPNGAIFTADPGTTGTATGEVTGGSPAYARKAINWGAVSNGVITGTATFDVPAGVTVTHAAVCVSATAGTADIRDRITITSQAFATQGTLAVTFSYTQS